MASIQPQDNNNPTSHPPGLHLDRDALARMFPFFIRIDRQLRITDFGEKLGHWFPGMSDNIFLEEALNIDLPTHCPLFQQDSGWYENRLVILTHRVSGKRIKGQVIVDRESEGSALFLGTLCLQSDAELKESGLTLSDFPIHDSVNDFLALLETKENMLRESSELQRRVVCKNNELSAREALYSSLINNLPDAGVILFNSKFEVQSVRGRDLPHPFLAIARKSEPCPLEDLELDEASQANLREHLRLTMSGESRQFEAQYGQEIFSHATELLDSLEDQPLQIILLVHNLTDRKQLEREAARSAQLESIGLLAGGIAHDFNNFLAGILGNISVARAEIPRNTETHRALTDAEKACLDARGLTRQLLTFSKGGKPVCEERELREIIESNVRFILRGSGVELIVTEEAENFPVRVDEGQITQVFNNLAINAMQAMNGRGILQIDIRNRAISSPQTDQLPDGSYLSVAVRDNGSGMTPEILENIWDPYFTTKESGSGLGLSTCYSIIRQHGGSIQVDSKPGAGSQFTILLPASGPARARKAAAPSRTLSASQPTREMTKGRVLVMDDDPSIRTLASRVFSFCNQEVVCVEDGDAALQRVEREEKAGSPFDVIILDLTIPGGRGGREIIQDLILKTGHRIPIIVSSGYSDDDTIAAFRELGFTGCLPKPYGVEEARNLLSELKEAMSMRTGVSLPA
ncbi:MAG: ATP-binding protein [Verrucomicrobiota bacterium]